MGIIYFIFSFILFIILFGIVMTPIIIFIIILATPRNNGKQSKTDNSLSNYTTKGYVMTRTELIFYRKLKEITDELNLSIACAFSLSVELSLMKIAVRFVVNPVNELEPYFRSSLSTSDFIEFSNVF